MAIGTSNAYSGPYLGNGSTTAFPFTFSVLSGDQVSVQVDGADVSSSAYSVSLSGDAPSNGTVTFGTAPANGATIYTYLNPAFSQDIEFADGAAWLAKPVNDGYDQSALRDQALKRDVRRSLLLPIGESAQTLPSADNRKGKFLAFDAHGNPVASVGMGSDSNFRADAAASTGSTLVGADDGSSGTLFTTVQGFITKLLSSVGASIIGFIQAGTGAVLRKVQDKLREIEISVKDFGAVGTALADDTNAIKTAIAAAKAMVAGGATGVTIKFPPGQYLVSSTITIDSSFIRLKGEGKKVSRLVRNAGYGDTISIYSGGFLEDIRVEGMGFYHDVSVGQVMSGAHINAHAVTFLEIRDNLFDSGAYGVVLHGCVYPRIEDNWFSGNYHLGAAAYNSIAAIVLQKTPLVVPVQYPTIVHIRRNTIVGGNGTYPYTEYPDYQYGIIVNCCEELHIESNTIIGMTLFNIYIQQNANNDPILDVFINHNFIDPAGSNGIRIEGYLGNGSQYIGKVQITDNQINGEGQADLNVIPGSGDAIYVDGTARAGTFTQACLDLLIADNIIDNWYGNGINIQGCLSADLTGNVLRNNNTANTKGASGIVLGSQVKQCNVSGGSSGYNNAMATAYTLYGVTIANGAQNVVVDGVNVTGNATGGVLDNTAAPTTAPRTNWVVNCKGYNGNRAIVSPAIPASGVDQYNPTGAPAFLSIFNGTVTDIKLNGTTIQSSTGAKFQVGPGDKVQMTYTVAPSWIWWPQ